MSGAEPPRRHSELAMLVGFLPGMKAAVETAQEFEISQVRLTRMLGTSPEQVDEAMAEIKRRYRGSLTATVAEAARSVVDDVAAGWVPGGQFTINVGHGQASAYASWPTSVGPETGASGSP